MSDDQRHERLKAELEERHALREMLTRQLGDRPGVSAWLLERNSSQLRTICSFLALVSVEGISLEEKSC